MFIDLPVDPLLSVVILGYYFYSEYNIFIFCFRCAFIYIVWFDYIVANYVTVIPHRAHR